MALKSTRRSRLIDRGIQMQGNGVLVAADCPRRKRCIAHVEVTNKVIADLEARMLYLLHAVTSVF